MTVTSHDPRSGEQVSTLADTTCGHLSALLRASATAAPALAAQPPAQRRRWLEAVADALEARCEELAELAERETALGRERLLGEIARTAGQLRFYGEVAVEGSYLGVTIDEQTPTTPRLVRANRPLGPVAVFGASNFPFAFGILGNDTASALAAGCPVVAKAHPAHIGLSVLLAEVATNALASAGAPEGTFAVVSGHQAGIDLVTAPEITAVGFTGSQAGGLALWRIANSRDVAIPVYAEMGTVNPVVVTRLREMNSVATEFIDSLTLGHGQFCTKPGLILAPRGSGAADAVATALRAVDPGPVMLTEAIADAVRQGIHELQGAGAEVVARVGQRQDGWAAPAAILRAEVSALTSGSRLLEECFGSVAVVCEYGEDRELHDALETLQGSLAASIITAGPDDPQGPELVRILSGKVGRVVVNGWPTGVSYTWAQHHGGPWPATSHPAATSVGAHGLDRFVRPVAYQSTHDEWLPPAAQAANPWRVLRRVNGELQLPVEDAS